MRIPDRAIAPDKELVSFFTEQAHELEKAKGDDVLANAFCVVGFFNSLAEQRRASILDKMLEYLKKLKEKLDGIAKEWGVHSYSIEVGFTGITLSLEFEPK
jgi:F0F1-type ATP synthase delta subunit